MTTQRATALRFLASALIASGFLGSGAAMAASRTIALQRVEAEFRLAAGDAEFAGHGPDVSLTVAVRVSNDKRSLLADIKGTAKEVGGTTRAVLEVAGLTVYTAESGASITAVLGPATSATVAYRDTDHGGDFVCEGVGEIPIVDGDLPFKSATGQHCVNGLVRAVRFIGDTNGADVNTSIANFRLTRTSAEVIFAPIAIDVTLPRVALVPLVQQPVQLAVPYGDYPQENFVGNNCGSSAGFRLLQYYGSKITYDQMVSRVRSRANATNLVGLGVPPGMLRDALNEVSPGFSVVNWAYAADNETLQSDLNTRSDLKEKLVGLLRQGKPMIALLGWGSETAYRAGAASTVYHGFYAPIRDDARIDQLHYVVIRGYNPLSDTFDVVDNGMGKTWRSDFLLNMMLFDRGTDFQMLINSVAPDVRPATVIYKK